VEKRCTLKSSKLGALMLDVSDFQSHLIAGALSIAAGGGLYGLYLKTMTETAVAQTEATTALSECLILQGGHDPLAGRAFLADLQRKLPGFLVTDAVAGSVASIGASVSRPGLGQAVERCARTLEAKVARLEQR
jgi:hypothetical protein